MNKSAALSECGTYRYSLARSWTEPGQDPKTVCFVMLNPSKADAMTDDPTVRRCVGFARSWGYNALEVRNLFCLRATDPKELLTHPNPVPLADPLPGVNVIPGTKGPGDEAVIGATAADLIVCAWGDSIPPAKPWGSLRRDAQVLHFLRHRDLYCLGLTARRNPKHPVRLPGNLLPVLFRKAAPLES